MVPFGLAGANIRRFFESANKLMQKLKKVFEIE
jgi:hypothetical protein